MTLKPEYARLRAALSLAPQGHAAGGRAGGGHPPASPHHLLLEGSAFGPPLPLRSSLPNQASPSPSCVLRLSPGRTGSPPLPGLAPPPRLRELRPCQAAVGVRPVPVRPRSNHGDGSAPVRPRPARATPRAPPLSGRVPVPLPPLVPPSPIRPPSNHVDYLTPVMPRPAPKAPLAPPRQAYAL